MYFNAASVYDVYVHFFSTVMYANLFGNSTSFQTLYMLQGSIETLYSRV